jgi:hypothetical protein
LQALKVRPLDGTARRSGPGQSPSCAKATRFTNKKPIKRFCIDGFDVGKHADGLETRMKPMTSLAEQAGFEPAEGY